MQVTAKMREAGAGVILDVREFADSESLAERVYLAMEEAKRQEVIDRRAKICKLRDEDRLTFKLIGAQFGITGGRALKIYQKATAT